VKIASPISNAAMPETYTSHHAHH